jgi:predicted transcriptional regulator
MRCERSTAQVYEGPVKAMCKRASRLTPASENPSVVILRRSLKARLAQNWQDINTKVKERKSGSGRPIVSFRRMNAIKEPVSACRKGVVSGECG